MMEVIVGLLLVLLVLVSLNAIKLRMIKKELDFINEGDVFASIELNTRAMMESNRMLCDALHVRMEKDKQGNLVAKPKAGRPRKPRAPKVEV